MLNEFAVLLKNIDIDISLVYFFYRVLSFFEASIDMWRILDCRVLDLYLCKFLLTQEIQCVIVYPFLLLLVSLFMIYVSFCFFRLAGRVLDVLQSF